MNSVATLTSQWAHKHKVMSFFQSEANSTQSLAKAEFFGQASPLLVLCEHQTAGRGRGSNLWQPSAEMGGQLLSTWCFRLPRPPTPVMAAVIGLNLYQSLISVWPEIPLSLKAPNDLYLKDKKVGGILIEIVAQIPNHDFYLGIGLNVFDFPKSVSTAGCLMDVISRSELIAGWDSFLSDFKLRLNQLIENGSQQLSAAQCFEIQQALNLWPGLAQSYTAVRPDGGLEQGSRLTHWTEL